MSLSEALQPFEKVYLKCGERERRKEQPGRVPASIKKPPAFAGGREIWPIVHNRK